MLTTQYKRLWDDQGFRATLVTHWRRYEAENYQYTFKRKACAAGLGGSDEDEDSDSAEDEIDIPEDDELPSYDAATMNESDDM